MSKSYLHNNSVSRGLRNNNPGNLTMTNINWNGKIPNNENTDGTFEQFYDLYYGIRAMALDIINDVKDNNYTLSQLLNEYAPPSDNNTQDYINAVSQATGVPANIPIVFTYPLLFNILRAMIGIENGSVSNTLITDSDINNSIQLLPEVILNTLGEIVMQNSGKLAIFILLFSIGGLAYIIFRNR